MENSAVAAESTDKPGGLSMILRYCLILLLFAVTVSAEWTPESYSSYVNSENPLEHKLVSGGTYMENYQLSDDSWVEIDTSGWTSIDDTLFTHRNAFLKADVNDQGQVFVSVKVDGITYTIAQRLIKLIWINTATKNWTDVVPSVNWSTPAVNKRTLTFSNVFPAIDYKIRKRKGLIQHAIAFKPAFLDSAVTLYNQRSDSSNIALGNVIVFQLTNVDNPDSAVGEMTRRDLMQFGKRYLSLREQRLRYPGSDSLDPVEVKQRWVKQNGKIYCVEFVMMSDVKRAHEANPSAVVWHNTTLNVQVTASSDDAVRYSGATFSTTQAWARIGFGTSANSYDYGARFLNITIAGTATVSSAKMSFWNRISETKHIQLLVSADDADDAATFSDHADWVARPRTTANVLYDPGDISYTADAEVDITGLGAAIQEVIDRGSWSSGNAIAILVDGQDIVGNEYTQWSSYDQATSEVCKLEVIYTAGGGGPTDNRRRQTIINMLRSKG